MLGNKIKLPTGYEGLVIKNAETDSEAVRKMEQQRTQDGGCDEESEGNEEQERTLETIGQFDAIMLWGHEGTITENDAFVRGVQEWITFAETVRSRCQA